jgi:ribosomal protein S9
MLATKKDSISGDSLGTGRRKTAIARVRLKAGSGQITVNDLTLEQYFPVFTDRQNVLDALEVTGQREAVDVTTDEVITQDLTFVATAAARRASRAPAKWALPGPSAALTPRPSPRSGAAAF